MGCERQKEERGKIRMKREINIKMALGEAETNKGLRVNQR
jgi:hypothetical protein